MSENNVNLQKVLVSPLKKNYSIVHVKIEIIKKPQFKHMVYI